MIPWRKGCPRTCHDSYSHRWQGFWKKIYTLTCWLQNVWCQGQKVFCELVWRLSTTLLTESSADMTKVKNNITALRKEVSWWFGSNQPQSLYQDWKIRSAIPTDTNVSTRSRCARPAVLCSSCAMAALLQCKFDIFEQCRVCLTLWNHCFQSILSVDLLI